MRESQPKIIEQDIEVYIEVHPWTDKDFDQITERAVQQIDSQFTAWQPETTTIPNNYWETINLNLHRHCDCIDE